MEKSVHYTHKIWYIFLFFWLLVRGVNKDLTSWQYGARVPQRYLSKVYKNLNRWIVYNLMTRVFSDVNVNSFVRGIILPQFGVFGPLTFKIIEFPEPPLQINKIKLMNYLGTSTLDLSITTWCDQIHNCQCSFLVTLYCLVFLVRPQGMTTEAGLLNKRP